MVALVVAGVATQASAWFYPALIVPAAMFAWQVRAIDIDDPALCLHLFRRHREIGLAVALAILLGRL